MHCYQPVYTNIAIENSSNIWLISDTHYNHKNVIAYCNRPFLTMEEMNDVLTNNINNVVKADDILIHCGDFAYGRDATKQSITDARNKINCQNIYLVKGNHDRLIRKYKLQHLFKVCTDVLSLENDRYICCFTHKPHDSKWSEHVNRLRKSALSSNKRFRHFFGHVHHRLECAENLSVENIGYKPVLFDNMNK